MNVTETKVKDMKIPDNLVKNVKKYSRFAKFSRDEYESMTNLNK